MVRLRALYPCHTLAVDSKGDVYVAETDWGRRVQKFKLVK
jgi:hypothetical protein